MKINTNQIVSISEANQNFSRIARLVDRNGEVYIFKNNKPKYIVVSFDEYDEIKTAMQNRKKKISDLADELLSENMEALTELAK